MGLFVCGAVIFAVGTFLGAFLVAVGQEIEKRH